MAFNGQANLISPRWIKLAAAYLAVGAMIVVAKTYFREPSPEQRDITTLLLLTKSFFPVDERSVDQFPLPPRPIPSNFPMRYREWVGPAYEFCFVKHRNLFYAYGPTEQEEVRKLLINRNPIIALTAFDELWHSGGMSEADGARFIKTVPPQLEDLAFYYYNSPTEGYDGEDDEGMSLVKTVPDLNLAAVGLAAATTQNSFTWNSVDSRLAPLTLVSIRAKQLHAGPDFEVYLHRLTAGAAVIFRKADSDYGVQD